MFSYNCEKCGREVPPSYSECPDCAAKAGASPVAAAVLEPEAPAMPQAPAAPARPAAVQTPQAPARPAAPPRPQQVAAPGGGVPGWAVALGVGAVLILGGYLFIQVGLPAFRGSGSGATEAAEPAGTAAATVETAATGATDAAPEVAKYVQVTGLRINEVNRRPQVSMVVINHAAAELVDIKSTVLIKTTKSKPGDAPIAKVELKLSSLGPNEVKDVTVSLPTSLRAYELPDWQFLTAEITPSK